MEYYDGKLSFIVEWYDEEASLAKRYILNYHEDDCTIEMISLSGSHKMFLHRTRVEGVCKESLILGNCIHVLGRSVIIQDYADIRTRKLLHAHTERAILLLQPEMYEKMGEVMQVLEWEGFKIRKMETFRLSMQQASEFYKDFEDDLMYRNFFVHLASGPIVVFELTRQDAMKHLISMTGDIDPEVARSKNPGSLRAKYGIDRVKNAMYIASTHAHIKRDLSFLFENSVKKETCVKVNKEHHKKAISDIIYGGGKPDHLVSSSVTYKGSACVVIKPHALGQAAKILQRLLANGFKVSACYMCQLDKVNAEEFYEVYRGVLVEYSQMVKELCTGPCMALEVKYREGDDGRGERGDAEERTMEGGGRREKGGEGEGGGQCWDKRLMVLRNFVGPPDPEMARHIRPNSLRALFGQDRIHNGIHVTDLPEDCVMELEYFFKLMHGF